jgi:hypothetical protein
MPGTAALLADARLGLAYMTRLAVIKWLAVTAWRGVLQIMKHLYRSILLSVAPQV